DQRVGGGGAVKEISDGPGIGGRDGRDAVQDIIVGTDIRAGHDAPRRAVPVLDQRLVEAAGITELPHGPDIAGRGSRDAVQEVVEAGVRARYDAPGRTVPVLDQCAREIPRSCSVEPPYSPDIAA